ncbi:aspartate carbamoyltransferase [Aureibacillus halotolerans]|uniref:Aspartate carbamoyltransferase n=1 Tax=Aureibacillus halotolerans TaxID=1508390 RepID=A0A4R6U502_9BACI|nr:aspartate carbamoyltransferase [Aureibacillus halotolerans]TDQ40806.1 aspartate carbamoyltransferase [Aureibacillus halotolerans]
MKHLITCEQFEIDRLESLFALADDMKANPELYHSALSSRIVATLFYEPSTRTRLSFEAAVQKLGGGIISTENAKEMSSAIKGENLLDTIRVVEGYCDAIVLRHFDDNAAQDAASISHIPIINAGGGAGEHPTQALLDAYTIYSYKQTIHHRSFALIGDLRYGRTIHSLVKLISLYDGVKVYGLSQEDRKLPEVYIDYLQARGIAYQACERFEDLPTDIDVLYQTRTQTERFANGTSGEFVIDKKVMEQFGQETILLHPLPRNNEIALDVDGDPRAVYFQQSHLGLYARMALLDTLLNGK